MMNRKQSLKDHSMIRCPKNMQQTDRGTPHTEAWFQQSYCHASLLKLHFGTGAPAPMEGALKKEDVYCRIYFGIHSITLSYDTTLHVPKQSSSKKLNIVQFVLMINDKPVIACYLLQCGISSSFHIFSLFLSLTGSSNITAKQT